MTETITTTAPLSARCAAALDVYEEVLFLRDLVDRIDEIMAVIDRGADRPQHLYYFVVGDEDTELLFRRIWYVEISHARLREAEQALSAATDRYAEAFQNATLHRNDLHSVVLTQGLPHPHDVRRAAADRPALQPWWRRRRRIGFWGLGGHRILTAAPTGPKHVALNIPDPSAAIGFWRANVT